MKDNMILIMIDECGDEVEVKRFSLSGMIDEDELELWQERKIRKAHEEYPEARGFYFEDRRSWDMRIAYQLAHPWEDVCWG